MKKSFSLLICILLVISACCVFQACGNNDQILYSTDLMKEVYANEINDIDISKEFIAGYVDFAFELFREQKIEGNSLISPLSIMLALAMTANGAVGDTQTEMLEVLSDGMSMQQLNDCLYSYVNSLPSNDSDKLSIANSIWFRKDGIYVLKSFLQTNADYYGAQAYAADFDRKTVDDINAWVNKKTDGMVGKIIEDIDSSTVMFLINALLFDAEWETKYTKGSTVSDTFYNQNGSEVTTDFLCSSEKIAYTKTCVRLTKMYKNGNYSYVALMPNQNVGLDEFMQSIDYEYYCTIMNSVGCEATVRIPKYENEYDTSLKDCLYNMGMVRSFGACADFTGMSAEGGLFISDVIHKTHIVFDEAGTKAGAVTAVIMSKTSMPSEKPVYFNRPFVYFIVDNTTKLPIFVGTLENF
ncbi:MAG: serpin family protein [Clostridia bacterium]|nr:serpin family protein [Clostridia bacterium]